GVEPLVPLQLRVLLDGCALLLQARAQAGEPVDQERRMGLASRSEVFLDSEMQLEGSAPGAEPASFASRQVIGLRDALKAENLRVEPLSPILLPGRHCQLDVVETP